MKRTSPLFVKATISFCMTPPFNKLSMNGTVLSVEQTF
jgi:hypothetical protein